MSKYKRDFTDDVTIEEAPTVESFDFTVDESVMPARTRLAYYRLRRAALTRNDPSATATTALLQSCRRHAPCSFQGTRANAT